MSTYATSRALSARIPAGTVAAFLDEEGRYRVGTVEGVARGRFKIRSPVVPEDRQGRPWRDLPRAAWVKVQRLHRVPEDRLHGFLGACTAYCGCHVPEEDAAECDHCGLMACPDCIRYGPDIPKEGGGSFGPEFLTCAGCVEA